jgi:putative ABC transport system permease protein
MAQSWLEAGLQTSVAAVLALLLLVSIKPWIEASSGIGLLYFLTRGAAPFVVLAAVVAIVSLVAGAYPALVLSRIPPLDAVQPGRSRGGPRFVAQVLVGLQFASASFLTVVVTIMHLQRASLEDVALLPHRDPVIVLNDVRRAGIDFATLETELRKIPTVREVASISANRWSGTTETIRYARDPAEGSDAPLAQWRNGSEGYFATLGLEVLAGRVFAADRDARPGVLYSADDTNNTLIVVDRTYAERLGFASPADAVDALIHVPENLQRDRRDRNQPPAPPARIIGVTETETTYLESGAAEGVVHVFAPELRAVRQIPLIRVGRDDLRGTVAAVTRTWDRLAPKAPVNIRFFDDLFELRFRSFAAVSQLFVLLAASACVIAAIGQLGIAVHVATRRRREVGLRKTLGSTTSGIARLLLVDFGKPVLAANVAAWPLAYVAAGEYLQAFAHRIEVTPWPFVLSLGLALAIAFGTVIAVVLKTARLAPADVLRQA